MKNKHSGGQHKMEKKSLEKHITVIRYLVKNDIIARDLRSQICFQYIFVIINIRKIIQECEH